MRLISTPSSSVWIPKLPGTTPSARLVVSRSTRAWHFGAPKTARADEFPEMKTLHTKETTTICPYCGVGCGLVVSTRDGNLVNIEGDADHPINEGALCSKGMSLYQVAKARSSRRTPCSVNGMKSSRRKHSCFIERTKRSAIARPAASSFALLTRKPEDSRSSD